MSKVISLLITFSMLCLLCTPSSERYRQIKVKDYLDKMKAGWVGQMVGVGWGGPTEFKWKGEIIPADQIPQWKPEMVNQHYQDDIYVEMTFLRTLEQYGFSGTPTKPAGTIYGPVLLPPILVIRNSIVTPTILTTRLKLTIPA